MLLRASAMSSAMLRATAAATFLMFARFKHLALPADLDCRAYLKSVSQMLQQPSRQQAKTLMMTLFSQPTRQKLLKRLV
jgi:hypothetical protein